jgi:2-polyprenyl-3-methyl-5-hydroxy-6-metoxy-1,4-benzoquinol methylase
MDFCQICKNGLKNHLNEVFDSETFDKFEIKVCPNCSLKQTFLQPKSLEKYYVEYHGKRHSFTENLRMNRRFSLLKRCKNSENLLDIGCGNGSFLELASKTFRQVIGTEFNLPKIDFPVYKSLLEVKNTYGKNYFDAITLWHSLEHFTNLIEVLDDVDYLLKDNGLIFIAVPNSSGWQAKLFGVNWLHLDVPRHLFHFDPKSLAFCLQKYRFEIKKISHQEFEYDLLGWSQSALNSIFKIPNIFFKTLMKKDVKIGKFALLLNFILGIVFSALFLPVSLLASICGKGGTIVVTAAKYVER